MNPLVFISYNTWKAQGAYRKRLHALAHLLQWHRPALCCLQECFASDDGMLDTARFLAASLDMQLVYAPLRPKRRACEGHTMPSTSGLAVLVHKSYKLLTHAMHMLVSDASDGQRAVQLLAVQSPWGTLGIANTHLTHIKSAGELRCAQLQETITALGSLTQCQHRIIAGDMNMVVAGELLESQKCAADMTLLDCYTQGGGGAGDSTLIGARRAGESNRRIDYIFSLAPPTHHPVCSGAELIGVDAVTAWGERPSDHAGVVVKLNLHKGEVAAVVDPDE